MARLAAAASLTSTSRMATPMRPPPGMASRAFTARFMRTCCIWLGSTLTRPEPSTGSTDSSTSSPIIRWSIGTSSATSGPSSSTRGWTTCLRLKARSWLVSATARCDVFWIRSTSRCIGSPALSRPSSMWARPLITVSRLLKSWATPPASRPIASIFWACCSCISRLARAAAARFCSVRSRM